MGCCIIQNKVQFVSKKSNKSPEDNSKLKINGIVPFKKRDRDSCNTEQGTPILKECVDINFIGRDNNNHNTSYLSVETQKKIEYVLTLEVNNNDIQCPFWIEKHQIIKFEVKGVWSINKLEGYCNSEGYYKDKEKKDKKLFRKFGLGALLGRVLGGPYFEIRNNTQIKSEGYGPLFLCTNTDEYCNDIDGSIEIKIYGLCPLEYSIIDEKLEWNVNYLTKDIEMLNDEEKLHINYINKLRSNPEMFANYYLKNLITKGNQYNDLYNYIKSLSPLQLLQPSRELIAFNKIQVDYLGKSGTTSHLSEKGYNLQKRLRSFNIKTNCYESYTYGVLSAFDNLINLLLDEFSKLKTNRSYLLNNNFTLIGVAMNNHIIYKKCWINIYSDTNDKLENSNYKI